MNKNIIILGPPLSGKGTQGQLLAERLGVPRLSVGALIRRLYQEKRKEGIEVAKFILAGKAIPGDLLIKILNHWFKKHNKGFVIDNLIRTKDQLKAFAKYSQEDNFQIDKVIYLTIPESEIVKRFKIRLSEHQRSNRVREDETEQILKKRIEIYHSSKKMILDYFRKQHILSRICGNHSVGKVHEDILGLFGMKINGD